jgi:hypothetical protein
MMSFNTPRRKLSVPLTLEEFIAPQKTALVMWDMQKGLAGRAVNINRIKAAVLDEKTVR